MIVVNKMEDKEEEEKQTCYKIASGKQKHSSNKVETNRMMRGAIGDLGSMVAIQTMTESDINISMSSRSIEISSRKHRPELQKS
jgi:hypothetical protein